MPENKKMRSAGLFEWISGNQPPDGHEYAHGWWNSIKFLQLLSTDFEDFEFDVITSFPMETPPPSSTITMPVVWARRPNLEIIWKESWVVEPYFAVTVKWGFPSPIILLNVLEPIDQQDKWLLRDFPTIASSNFTVKELLPFLVQSKISTCFTRCFTSSTLRSRPMANRL